MLNNFFFIGLPYLALGLLVVGFLYRYLSNGFTVSSLSSQFLESSELFWGSVPFHWGIVTILLAHLWAFFLPSTVLGWNASYPRLLLLEITGFALGLGVLLGLGNLLMRRLLNARVGMVTTKMDIALEFLLLLQVIAGLVVAYNFRWGSSWFAGVMTPYLRSIFMLQPDISAMSAMPFFVQLHVVLGFVLIGLIPFTRLIHFLVFPFDYYYRRYQQVTWNWDKSLIRDPQSPNTVTPSRNN